jgi:hypothetical protein
MPVRDEDILLAGGAVRAAHHTRLETHDARSVVSLAVLNACQHDRHRG